MTAIRQRGAGADGSVTDFCVEKAPGDDERVVSVGACPWLIPGITLNTSPTDHQPIKKMRETGLSGKTWELLDEGN